MNTSTSNIALAEQSILEDCPQYPVDLLICGDDNSAARMFFQLITVQWRKNQMSHFNKSGTFFLFDQEEVYSPASGVKTMLGEAVLVVKAKDLEQITTLEGKVIIVDVKDATTDELFEAVLEIYKYARWQKQSFNEEECCELILCFQDTGLTTTQLETIAGLIEGDGGDESLEFVKVLMRIKDTDRLPEDFFQAFGHTILSAKTFPEATESAETILSSWGQEKSGRDKFHQILPGFECFNAYLTA